MPRKPMPWFRFYVEAVHDRKLRRQDPAVRWLWVAILAIARQSPTPGLLLLSSADDQGEPVELADLADVAAVDLATVEKGTAEFERLGMLTRDGRAWRVTKWDDRQFESDDVTKRTRRHRDTKEQRRNVPTSFQGTAPETETETEKKNTHNARARAKKSRAHPMPGGWEPNDTHHRIATDEGIDLRREADKFRDWAAAKGRTYVDWDRAFASWLRNDQYRTRASPTGNVTKLTAAEQRTQRSRDARRQALAELDDMGLP